MSFKKNKYIIIKNIINKDLANFNLNYLLVKKQVFETCLKTRYMSPFEKMLGAYEDEKTGQVLNTFSCYADIAMETLMLKCQPLIEKATGLKLFPAYSYARVYKKGDELKRHKDRFSCEISSTMNLGGDDWPIYLSPYENVGLQEAQGGKKGITAVSQAKGIKVNLKPGDMLVYKGIEIEHWREKFKKKECVQVFFHYNDSKTPGSKENIFDRRPHLGLPSWFKK